MYLQHIITFKYFYVSLYCEFTTDSFDIKIFLFGFVYHLLITYNTTG